MIIPLILLLIPAMLYETLPDHAKRIVLGITCVVLFLFFVYYVRKILAEYAAQPAAPAPTQFAVWSRGLTASEFQVAFLNHLRKRGFQIIWSTIADDQRIAVIVEKRRRKTLLFCFADSGTMRELDYTSLARWQSEQRPQRSLLIVQRPIALSPGAKTASPLEMLTYAQLADPRAFA